MCALINPRDNRKPRPLLCYVTDRRILSETKDSTAIDALLRKIEQAVSGGVDWIQIREKDLSSKALAHLVREAMRIAASGPGGTNATRILVNDRVDVALAERAGGVHLAENSLHVGDARALLRKIAETGRAASDFLIGVSCHSREAAEAAAASGADYVFFGPVFATPSKAAFGAPQGVDRLAEVCRAVSVPVLAIGGVTLENAAHCLKARAAGIAAIRLFQDAANAKEQVRLLHDLTR